jgi:CheY-like chemotaxis protein
MTPQPRRENPLVLIVDDDLASRELLASYLEPEGYAIVMVSSGTEAIEEARRSLPDLIVTDVLMPGPGGLQTLFVLRNTTETSHIPAIVVSGISPRILGLMPAAAYLVKPVEKHTFVQAVRKYINPSSDTWQQTAEKRGLRQV